MSANNAPPVSVTNLYINGTALLVSLGTLWWLVDAGTGIAPAQAVLFLGASYAFPIIVLEAIWRKPPVGGNRQRDPAVISVPRVLVKLLGLAMTILVVAGVYWLFPEYRGAFYNRYYKVLLALAPWVVSLTIPYFFWMDRRTGGERDGYWHMGQLAMLRWAVADRRIIGQHLLGWLVKLFFLPLMFIYLTDKVDFLRFYDYGRVFGDFRSFYDFAFESLFYVDLLIAFVGYLCTFKATNSHIRSTEPTLLGWAVAILCYQPFWSFFSVQYLDYQADVAWGNWFWQHSTLYVTWGMTILFLTGIYAWASLAFGIRFSNLTHRGILTNGPYRYCKHPAYLSKNLSWWLLSMPFMISVSMEESLRHTLLLLMLNAIYLLRARTEERHLSRDPDYREYARYIEDHGMLRVLGNWLPMLRFKPGHLFNLRERH